MRRFFVLVAILGAFACFFACKKNTSSTAGKGGSATLIVKPYLSSDVNNLLASDTLTAGDTTSRNLIGKVYIKYNDQDTLVTDISSFADDSVIVSGTAYGDIQFYNLNPGFYYVYFKGTIYKDKVNGGNSYFLNETKEVPVYIIPQ